MARNIQENPQAQAQAQNFDAGMSRGAFLKRLGALGLTAATVAPLSALATEGLTGAEAAPKHKFETPFGWVTGVPDQVRNTLTVDVANSKFGGRYTEQNPLFKIAFAEPGADPKQSDLNSVTQQVLNGSKNGKPVTDGFLDLPAGAWLYGSFQGTSKKLYPETGGTAVCVGKTMPDDSIKYGPNMHFPEVPNHVNLVFIRGMFGDNSDQDLARRIRVKNVDSGENQFEQIFGTNGTAFLSEGWFGQILEAAHKGKTINGNGFAGVELVTAHILNANDGAYLQATQHGIDGRWTNIKTNVMSI